MGISFGVSYYGTHFPWHFEKDLKELKASGINHIVFAASEYELDFYLPSTKEIYRISKKYNVEFIVNFWAHGNTFGGEGGSFFIFKNIDTWQVLSSGRIIPKACFNNPKFLYFMKAQIKKIANFSDGIFFDEPAFYNNKKTKEKGCFCKYCKLKFKKQYKKNIENASTKQLTEFKNKSLVCFIDSLAKLYKDLNSKGKTFICLYPAERDETLVWEDFLSLKSIDVFGSDPYWQDPYWLEFINKGPEFVKDVGQKITKECKIGKKQSQIWIQNFKIKNSFDIPKAVEYAKQCKPDYITAWTYKGACYSVLSNKNWKKSWELLLKSYKE
ncbi:hypothetical protein KO465_02720 [Candidatus Micrarchaeota archaeon]|nr:hypothetical protein [Candidatus Micrarchaeota archaeon]